MNVYLHVSFLCTALFHPIYPQFIRAYIEKWKKKIIFSLYYVSVAKNGVFVHKHLRFWNKRKIPPKDSHFSARNPHEYSKLFFISVMLWKAKKKYLKKKLETREFFFLVQKKIQWEKVSKMKRFAPLLYHHPPSVAQFFDYFRVYSIFSHCSTHTEKKNHPYPKIRPPRKMKKSLLLQNHCLWLSVYYPLCKTKS